MTMRWSSNIREVVVLVILDSSCYFFLGPELQTVITDDDVDGPPLSLVSGDCDFETLDSGDDNVFERFLSRQRYRRLAEFMHGEAGGT